MPSTCPWLAHTASGLLMITKRPIQTRFRFGSAYNWLNLATTNNSLTHSSIGTWSPCGSHSIVSNKFQVLFHSPTRGSFHRSLTVLCAIGVKKYLALPSGLGRFIPDFSCLILLRNCYIVGSCFQIQDFNLLWYAIQALLLTKSLYYWVLLATHEQPYNPPIGNA